MNKQIYELAHQAGATRAYVGTVHEEFSFSRSELDYFARLLVQECVTQFELAKVHEEDDVDYGLQLAQDIIRDHFGV